MVDIGFSAEEETDPTAIWQNMMRFRLAAADQLIPDRLGEWDIDQTVAMDMSELSFPYINAVPPNRCGARVISPQAIIASVIRFLALRIEGQGSRFAVHGSQFAVRS